MSRGQARMIIALLGVIIVLTVAGIGGWLVWGRDSGGDATGGGTAHADEASTTVESTVPVDSVALLENAGVDSVNAAPVPEAVDAWGDYELHRSWSGTLRVFENGDPTPVSDDGGGMFPATMNGCGIAMYLVTFRSVNEDVMLDAQLLDAAGTVSATETFPDGWMLGTNCVTPQFSFNTSSGISNLGDVVYDVTEYRQSSVAQPAAQPAEQEPVVAPEQNAPEVVEPTLIECDNGLSIMGLYSDGTWRTTQECDTPEHRRSAQAEGVCGGLHGREEQPELWAELCQ